MFTTGTVTGSEIWERVARSPDVTCQPYKVQEVTKSFIMAVPDILKDLLNQKVTLETVMKARLRFLHHCRYFNYSRKILDAKPECSYGYFSREETSRAIEDTLCSDIELAEIVLCDPAAFMRRQNATELEIMQNPGGLGLRNDVLKKYVCGTLTISDLLRMQPEVIVGIG